MKKLTLMIALVALFASQAGKAGAATFSFPIDTARLAPGDSFNLYIRVVPQNEKIFTSKLAIDFPADILEAEPFVWAKNWIPLPVKGYDLIDNKAGKLVKTAGYPKGIGAPTAFGTMIFKAKTSGAGQITVSGDSLALNAAAVNSLKPPYPTIAVSVSAAKTNVRPPKKNIEQPTSPPVIVLPPPSPAPETVLPPKKTPLFDVSIKPAPVAKDLGAFILAVISALCIAAACFLAALYHTRRKNK